MRRYQATDRLATSIPVGPTASEATQVVLASLVVPGLKAGDCVVLTTQAHFTNDVGTGAEGINPGLSTILRVGADVSDVNGTKVLDSISGNIMRLAHHEGRALHGDYVVPADGDVRFNLIGYSWKGGVPVGSAITVEDRCKINAYVFTPHSPGMV